MKLFIPFMNGSLEYDCAKCGGACCKYGILPMTSNEASILFKEEPLLKYFVYSKDNEFVSCSKYSKCWFLDQKGACLIEKKRGYINKPLFCKAYPFKVIKCGKEYYIHAVTLCPTLTVADNNIKNKFSDINSIAADIVKLGITRSISISMPRLQLEKRIFGKIKNNLKKDSYLDFAVKQINLSQTIKKTKRVDDFKQNLQLWLKLLDIENINLKNKKITYELTSITSILRMMLYKVDISTVPNILMALYVFMLIYDMRSNAIDEPNPVYTYVSMLDMASGLAQLNKPKSKKYLLKYLNISSSKARLSFPDILESYMPDFEQRSAFIKELGNTFLVLDDQFLI